MGIVVTGGLQSGGITTRVYLANTGELYWEADHGAQIWAVTADSSGNVYTAGNRISSVTTRKYNNKGELQWSADHGTTVYGIAVDGSGNVITVGGRTSNVTTRKYNSDGTEITSGWPKDHGGIVYGVDADASDNVYTAGVYTSSVNVRKYNSSGTQQWTNFHGVDLRCIALLGSSYYAAGGVRNSSDGKTTRAGTNSTGTWNYFYDHGATVYGIAQAANSSGTPIDSIVTVGVPSSSKTTRQFPRTTGTDTWTANHGANVLGVAVDYSDGSVYTVGAVSSGVTTRKYTYAGTEITDGDWPLNHGDSVFAVAWSPFTPNFTKIPALEISLELGVPSPTFSVICPSLIIPLGLAIPTVPVRPVSPDVAGRTRIYRLYLTGGASLIELPMRGLQCRRRLGESTWLTVEIPIWSSALITAIAAVPLRELVIYAGYTSDGVEVAGEMMRATLTEIRHERDVSSGSIQLTGRATPATATVTSHVLTGVRQRGKDDAGRRTITCAVDPRIRPNHSVNDGLYTFTVGAILYRIDPADSVMWITESG